MTDEQQTTLLKYLATAGFTGDRFGAELRRKIQQSLPSFRLEHTLSYGLEQMSYDLRFKKDLLFETYSLESYTATHRDAIVIDHQTINGEDTAKLEREIADKNWRSFFNGKISDPELIASMTDLLNRLSRLSSGQNFDGIKIQEEIMYKYLPEALDPRVLRDLKIQYERSQEYHSSDTGILHTALAYFHLSGRFEDLHEKMSYLNLEGYFGIDLYQELEQELVWNRNSEAFELTFRRNSPEGDVELKVPFTKENGDFVLELYTLTFTPYPEIVHGTFNGVDSRELEDRMRKIDWHNDEELFTFGEDHPEMLHHIEEIQASVHRLSQAPQGLAVAEQLQLKFWTDATFFEDILEQSVWDRLESLPRKTIQLPCDVQVPIAYNLLCGRPVLESRLFPVPENSANWIRLDQSGADNKVQQFITVPCKLSRDDLSKEIDLLPLSHVERASTIAHKLCDGESVPVLLKNGNNILLEATPELGTFSIATLQGRPIATNIHFDPQWKPVQVHEEKQPQLEEAQVKKGRSLKKRRKGKGL